MKPILDACCGSKMFHFDKHNSQVVFQDIREPGDYSVYSKKVILNPDHVGDFRKMDFPDESFYLVIFDPPHLLRTGERGDASRQPMGTLTRTRGKMTYAMDSRNVGEFSSPTEF